MALSKLYSRINWRNYPSEESPINEANLNRMDAAINNIDNRVLEQETLKLDKQSAYGLVQDWTMDETTGIITITKLSGEQILFDLNIEKIPVGFELSADGILTMTTSDGTKMTANIGDMIPVLTFRDSDTIAVTVKGTGKNKTYSFAIKAGSVTGEMLEPNYLANVQTAAGQAQGAAEEAVLSAAATKTSATSAAASAGTAADSAVAAEQSASAAAVSESNALSCKNAAQTAAETAANAKDISVTKAAEANTYAQTAGQQAAEAAVSQSNAATSARIAESNAQTAIDKAVLAKSYAVGGTGTRPGEDTDNAMYYMQQAMQQTGGIPTKLSQLENDTGFITIAVSNLINYYTTNMVYTKTEVDAKLSAIPKFAIVAVDTLPTKDISETTIYLLREQTAGTNKCSEWVYINGAWEMLGDLDIDLSGYLVKTGDGSSLVEIFSQASELANIVSGEKHSVIFGKIAKAIATLIAHVKTTATATVIGHVKVDTALSSSSTNPVQNKAVNTALSGKLATTGDASDTTVAFVEATTMAELVTGEKQSTLYGKLKLAVKNVISIMRLLGTTDISAIGDGTVTGAITAVNTNTFNNKGVVADIDDINMSPAVHATNNNTAGTFPDDFTKSGYVEHIQRTSNILGQRYTEISINPRMAVRIYRDGAWSPWQKIMNENDLNVFDMAISGLTNNKGKLYRLMTRASGNTISFDWEIINNQRYLTIYIDSTLVSRIFPHQFESPNIKITEVQFPTKVSLVANQAGYLQMALDNIAGYTPVMYDISLIGGAGIVPYGRNINSFTRVVRIEAINLSNATVTMQPTIRVLWVRDGLL